MEGRTRSTFARGSAGLSPPATRAGDDRDDRHYRENGQDSIGEQHRRHVLLTASARFVRGDDPHGRTAEQHVKRDDELKSLHRFALNASTQVMFVGYPSWRSRAAQAASDRLALRMEAQASA